MTEKKKLSEIITGLMALARARQPEAAVTRLGRGLVVGISYNSTGEIPHYLLTVSRSYPGPSIQEWHRVLDNWPWQVTSNRPPFEGRTQNNNPCMSARIREQRTLFVDPHNESYAE